MSRLQVMQITHDLGVGGLPGVVATLCRNLDRDRFDVSVLCLNERGPLAEDLEAEGIPVHLLEGDGAGPDYFAFRRVADILREHGVEVIHTHNTQPFIDGGLGSILARTPTHVHTDHARKYPDKLRYLLAERLLSHFTYRVVGVSEHTSRKLADEVGIPSNRIVTIHNGIQDPMESNPVDPEAKREELNLPEDALVLGVGVRLAEQKGLGFLIEAMSEVVGRVPRARLVIAGYGPLRDDLEAQARELGVADSVHFLGRRLDMIEVMQVFDLYVLPSIWEGLPLVVLEAMAVGCPVVATDVGGVASAVIHRQNGLLVPPRRPQDLADAIIGVLGDEKRRSRFGREGRARYLEHFSAPAMARHYEALYARQDPKSTREVGGPGSPRAAVPADG